MTLTTAPDPAPGTDVESDRRYYAALWGTTNGRVRARETWTNLRSGSVKLALAGAAALLAYAAVTGAFTSDGEASPAPSPAPIASDAGR